MNRGDEMALRNSRAQGLPSIIIDFKSKAVSAMKRSERGVVAIIIKDAALSTVQEFRSVEQVPVDVYSEKNTDFITKCFVGIPAKVIVVPIPETNGNVADALKVLKSMKWNYLCMPEAATADVTAIETFVKSARQNDKKTFKAVLANSPADSEGIINYCTDVVVGTKPYTAQQYTSRIAGILAGLPLSRSATYYVLPEVTKIIESETPDADVDDGKLILINDGEKIKIARGVNSLTTHTVDKASEWSKIKIIEGMDLITEDIRSTFNDNYVGKVINTYSNKMLFVGSVNAYFKTLEQEYILDGSVTNRADIDVDAQELYLQGRGQDTSNMTDFDLRKANTGSEVFLSASIKLVDSMEDLRFMISI